MAWKKSRLECFYEKVAKDETTGCWNWIGYKNWGGYGGFFANNHRISAHRWSYEHFVGPIPENMTIDHVCRNTSCVNPEHLRVMTALENWLISDSLTAVNLRKTHCSKGHEFTEENTLRQGRRRRCRECRRVRSLLYYYYGTSKVGGATQAPPD